MIMLTGGFEGIEKKLLKAVGKKKKPSSICLNWVLVDYSKNYFLIAVRFTSFKCAKCLRIAVSSLLNNNLLTERISFTLSWIII